MRELRHRVAVITGAASGIGLALAGRFAEAGTLLVIADVEDDPLEEAAAELAGSGAEVLAVRTDVSVADEVEALATAAYERYGAVHVICNNAGVVHRGAAWEQSLEDWEWVLGVDLWGVIHGVKAFVPRMLEGGHVGHVVNTASIAGLVPLQDIASYDVAKAGVVALSESIYLDLKSREAPIGVSVLCPGLVNTRILESERNRPGGTPDNGDSMAGSSLDSPEGLDADDVAAQVLDAIRGDRFWVLPHPEYADVARQRAQAISPDGEPMPAWAPRT